MSPRVHDEAYEAIKERARERSATTSRKGRDIGSIPEVENPERRESCRRNFRLFMETYLPATFYWGWSDDHLIVIAAIEEAVLNGGLFAFAMPRGSGKTTIVEAAVLWSALFGHRKFIVPIGATKDKAEQIIDSFKMEIETNDLLLADFPEVCYPVQCLEGIVNRAAGQLCEGEKTRITWTGPEVVLPTIPGSIASGTIVSAHALLGAIRGLKKKLADGRSLRPDLVLPDDPQTDESARSPAQCDKRLSILVGAVLGLAGPGVDIAGVMPCTVICQGDMCDRILDRKNYPSWQGERMQMVVQMPGELKLWDEYAQIRRHAQEFKLGHDQENEFYLSHREAMDSGSKVAWESRKRDGEISAIQHAMNLRIDIGEESFDAEYQNTPQKKQTEEQEAVAADEFRQRLNNVPRKVIPADRQVITSFIDVQKKLLWWKVCAFTKAFGWSVVEYGTYPDQGRSEFTNDNAKITLESVLPGASLEEAIYDGLQKLTDSLIETEWAGQAGAAHHISRCLIDANWGQHTKLVYRFCRNSKHKGVLTPSHGKGVKASEAPMGKWKPADGDTRGDNWINRMRKDHGGVYGVTFDTNFWKTFTLQRAKVGMGSNSAMDLYGSRSESHRLLARHMESEYPVRVTSSEREVDEWKLKPGRPDNHWWDCLVGCGVAASMCGCRLETLRPANVRKKRRKRGGGFRAI